MAIFVPGRPGGASDSDSEDDDYGFYEKPVAIYL